MIKKVNNRQAPERAKKTLCKLKGRETEKPEGEIDIVCEKSGEHRYSVRKEKEKYKKDRQIKKKFLPDLHKIEKIVILCIQNEVFFIY